MLSEVNLLSVFKWEKRKGWDVLLRAYWRAFARRSHRVLLRLRAWKPSWEAGDPNLAAQVRDFAKRSGLGRPEELPPVLQAMLEGPVRPAESELKPEPEPEVEPSPKPEASESVKAAHEAQHSRVQSLRKPNADKQLGREVNSMTLCLGRLSMIHFDALLLRR